MSSDPPAASPINAATPQTSMTDAQLRRLRWAVRATLTLGVAASVAANVLHARPNPISQIIAAWPPLALLLTVELISRVPHHHRSLGVIRIAATAVIAGIATWVSYWHLAGVAARYGETEHAAAYLLPISVDGLVIVASVSLVEITARIRACTPAPTASTEPSAAALPPPGPTGTTAIPAAVPPSTPGAPATTATLTSTDPAAEIGGDPHDGATQDTPPTRPADAPQAPPEDNAGDNQVEPPDAAGETPTDDAPANTAAAVAYWHRRDPTLHPAEIATRIGKSERTVRRHWPPPATSGTSHVNGHLADSLRR